MSRTRLRRMRSIAAACGTLALFAAIGCEKPAPAPTLRPAARKVAPPPKALPEEPEPPIEFASAEQAVDAMIAAADARKSKDYLAAQEYLQKRRDEIVPAIAPRLQAGDLSLAAQVGLVRQLAFAGEAAIPALEPLTASEVEPVVRHNAIEQLSRIEPASPAASTILRGILREGPDADRMEALEGLQRMKLASKELGDELRALLASDAPEELRKKASEVLAEVDPRLTFEDRD